jgi:hypothetical protein
MSLIPKGRLARKNPSGIRIPRKNPRALAKGSEELFARPSTKKTVGKTASMNAVKNRGETKVNCGFVAMESRMR